MTFRQLFLRKYGTWRIAHYYFLLWGHRLLSIFPICIIGEFNISIHLMLESKHSIIRILSRLLSISAGLPFLSVWFLEWFLCMREP